MRQLLRVLLNCVGFLLVMAISGVICLIVSVYMLVELGLNLHGDYEYYGRYPALFVTPAVVGFFAPLLILLWPEKMNAQRRRALFRTALIAVVVVLALALLFWVLGLLGMF